MKGVTRTPRQSIKEALTGNREQGHEDVKRENEKAVPIQAIEAAGAMDRLVILGRPGGGKSTLSNHIVVTLANLRLGNIEIDEKLPEWDMDKAKIPVRIILREFAAWIPEDKKFGEEWLVWAYLEHLLTMWGCREHFRHLKHRLDDEGGAIFFDGLDEVKEEDEDKKGH